MARYTAGDSGDYAEIIIDYKKKDVKLINPSTGKNFEKNPGFQIGLFFMSFCITAFFIAIVAFFSDELDIVLTTLLIVFVMILSYTSLYALKERFPLPFAALHNYMQKIQNDYQPRKLVIVTELDSTIYKLPHAYSNNKLDYRAYGDFKKYLIKVHIFPKDFYWKTKDSVEKQNEEWEAWFYFTKIPKKGKLEVEFI